MSDSSTLKSFNDLSVKKIYKIVRREELEIHDSDEPSLILTLQDKSGHITKVWAPWRLREQLLLQAYGEELDDQQEVYIRPKGAKECKSEAFGWYDEYVIARRIIDGNYFISEKDDYTI